MPEGVPAPDAASTRPAAPSQAAAGGAPPEGTQPPPPREPPKPVSARSRHGLDWFVFFVADIQTGFGPFVAVFLTTQKWTQTDIGLVLTIGGLVSLFGQVPAGAFVDSLRFPRRAAAVALVLIGLSAFALALWPIFPVVVASRVVHAAASCVLGLVLVSLSLGLVGRQGLSYRLGRNTAFASAGTGIAAAGMGACAYFLSNHAVFFLSGALVVPALVALFRIRAEEIGSRGVPVYEPLTETNLVAGAKLIGRNRGLVIFAGCLVLFHLANAAMLPLAASMLTLRSSQAATIMVAAAIVVPQFTVTFLSPWVGLKAQAWGRRPLLLFGFGALFIRGILFTTISDPVLLVLVQILDGVSAAALGVLVPLVIADVTRSSGHFNLAQGAVGCAVGIGSSISTTVIGYISDGFGSHAAFVTMAVIAGFALALLTIVMPETRSESEEE